MLTEEESLAGSSTIHYCVIAIITANLSYVTVTLVITCLLFGEGSIWDKNCITYLGPISNLRPVPSSDLPSLKVGTENFAASLLFALIVTSIVCKQTLIWKTECSPFVFEYRCKLTFLSLINILLRWYIFVFSSFPSPPFPYSRTVQFTSMTIIWVLGPVRLMWSILIPRSTQIRRRKNKTENAFSLWPRSRYLNNIQIPNQITI